jgi:hypothetical protein
MSQNGIEKAVRLQEFCASWLIRTVTLGKQDSVTEGGNAAEAEVEAEPDEGGERMEVGSA